MCSLYRKPSPDFRAAQSKSHCNTFETQGQRAETGKQAAAQVKKVREALSDPINPYTNGGNDCFNTALASDIMCTLYAYHLTDLNCSEETIGQAGIKLDIGY
ncbi:MAG: hypothetical protein ACPGQS_14125 [Bradymonadia bacterium]